MRAFANDRTSGFFMGAWGSGGDARKTANYRGALILNRPPCRAARHEVQRLENLRRHARPDAGGERGGRRSSARCWSRASPAPARRCWPRKWRSALGMPLLQWHIKSTTKAQQGLYEYDAVSRLRDSQLADVDGGERVRNIHNYIVTRRALAGLHRRRAGGAADRRDRQGRHRVPERPAARDRPDGVLRLRDARARQGQAPAAGRSSPRTTRRSCPTRSCAAASSTTSSSPTPRR